jgi:hypothetical protein
MMRAILFFIAWFLVQTASVAQISLPVAMLHDPISHRFSASGVGGGNLSDFNLSKIGSNSSLQFGIEGVLYPGETTASYVTIKVNPITAINSKVVGDTTFRYDLKRLVFMDNDFSYRIGFRQLWYSKNEHNGTFSHGLFADGAGRYFKYENDSASNLWAVSSTLGYQLGYYTQLTSIGYIGVDASVYGNHLYFFRDSPTDKGIVKLMRDGNAGADYAGWGFRLNVHVNDFSIFVETKRLYSTSGTIVKDLSDRQLFSFGAIATGAIFRSRKE